jgi:DHA1 family multidrug resistance protein-like MFS transporter
VAGIGALSRETVVLLAGMALGSTATFMVTPLLALYLHEVVRLPTLQIGALLTLLLLTQQGLPAVAGVAADRWGAKRLLTLSIAVRALGCLGFATGATLPVLAVSSALMGVGGAASTPTLKALLVEVAGESRVEAFALRSAAANAGAVVGPLVGGLFFHQFRALFLVVLALYVGLWATVMRWVPAGEPVPAAPVAARSARAMLSDRLLVLFTLVSAGFWFLYSQFTFTVPIFAHDRYGLGAAVPVMYSVNAVIVIFLQYAVLVRSARWLDSWRLLAVGSALLAAAFAVLAFGTGIVALAVFTVVFSLGELLVVPLLDTIAARLAPRDQVGGYLGFVSLSWALGGLLAGAPAGMAYAAARTSGELRWFWLGNVAVALLTGLGYLLVRARDDMARRL